MHRLYETILGEENRIYYLTKFESFDKQGGGLKASWNWSALLVGPAWALYRKMYGCFFAWWGILFLSNLLVKTGSPLLAGIIFDVLWITFAVYANSLYHNSIKKKIAVAQLEIKDETKLLKYLRLKGGVNKWVIWVFLGLSVLFLTAILIPYFELPYFEPDCLMCGK